MVISFSSKNNETSAFGIGFFVSLSKINPEIFCMQSVILTVEFCGKEYFLTSELSELKAINIEQNKNNLDILIFLNQKIKFIILLITILGKCEFLSSHNFFEGKKSNRL